MAFTKICTKDDCVLYSPKINLVRGNLEDINN